MKEFHVLVLPNNSLYLNLFCSAILEVCCLLLIQQLYPPTSIWYTSCILCFVVFDAFPYCNDRRFYPGIYSVLRVFSAANKVVAYTPTDTVLIIYIVYGI